MAVKRDEHGKTKQKQHSRKIIQQIHSTKMNRRFEQIINKRYFQTCMNFFLQNVMPLYVDFVEDLCRLPAADTCWHVLKLFGDYFTCNACLYRSSTVPTGIYRYSARYYFLYYSRSAVQIFRPSITHHHHASPLKLLTSI